MNLALFDFDGTITHADSFTAFVKSAVPLKRQRWGRLVLAPWIIGYRAGFVSSSAIRQRLVKFGFQGLPQQVIEKRGLVHAKDYLPTVLREEAMERIAWHKAKGDRVIVVSASLEVYLQPWCEAMNIELLAVKLSAEDGVLTGNYVNGDCCGINKAKRVQEHVELKDYETVYAYGDTTEDNELLALAQRKYFRWRENCL